MGEQDARLRRAHPLDASNLLGGGPAAGEGRIDRHVLDGSRLGEKGIPVGLSASPRVHVPERSRLRMHVDWGSSLIRCCKTIYDAYKQIFTNMSREYGEPDLVLVKLHQPSEMKTLYPEKFSEWCPTEADAIECPVDAVQFWAWIKHLKCRVHPKGTPSSPKKAHHQEASSSSSPDALALLAEMHRATLTALTGGIQRQGSAHLQIYSRPRPAGPQAALQTFQTSPQQPALTAGPSRDLEDKTESGQAEEAKEGETGEAAAGEVLSVDAAAERLHESYAARMSGKKCLRSPNRKARMREQLQETSVATSPNDQQLRWA